MTMNRFLRELAWPFTELIVLLAIIAFALLATLSKAAGLLGLWLGVILLPALVRYLLMLLESRAYGRVTPVANVELFSLVENFWSLTPLVVLALLIWGGIALDRYVSALVAGVFIAATFAVVPAYLAVLAVTKSPLQALNPGAIARLIAACGWHYLQAPVAVALAYLIASTLAAVGAPDLLVLMARFYCLFLLFTFTGGLLNATGVEFSLSVENAGRADLPPPIDDRTRSRSRVLNHAYGFFSRDNRAGAMAHIRAAIQDDVDLDGAYRWYFDEMLKWESKDAALMLAQSYLTRLLDEQRDVEAVKLISRCLLENPLFKPLSSDLDAALAAAARLDRNDLARALET
jgi:hypothetical protein